MALLAVTSKAGLRAALADLVVDASGIRHTGFGFVDCHETYVANVHDPPADPALPGFGQHAFLRNAEKALDAFKHFCRCQYGQKKRFVFKFGACGVALAPFDGGPYGDGYLVLQTGAAIAAAAPPCEPEGWAFGALGTGSCGWFPPSYVAWA
jgi:hypothetical protein